VRLGDKDDSRGRPTLNFLVPELSPTPPLRGLIEIAEQLVLQRMATEITRIKDSVKGAAQHEFSLSCFSVLSCVQSRP